MYKSLVVFLTVFIMFRNTTLAASTAYYMQYKNTYREIAKELVVLQEKCVKEKKITICDDVEVFSRNLIAKKVQAFGEYFELTSNIFLNTFPSLNDEGLIENIEDVNLQLTALKFSAVSFQPYELAGLERTTNDALKIHSELASFLSVNYHYYKLQKLYLVYESTAGNLQKEIMSAKTAGLNISLADKELKSASDKLTLVKERMKDTARLYEKGQTSKITNDVKRNIIELYSILLEINSHLLKASNILFRLSDNSYWEIK